MFCQQSKCLMFLPLILLLIVGCGSAAVEPFPLPSPSVNPPLSTPAPTQLLVLHTNDNWGETEPCG